MEVEGKIVLITGASSGIGVACAREFAAAGARLILAARRGRRLEELADELGTTFGTEILTSVVDVRERVAITRWIRELPTAWQAISILVNNAGLARGVHRCTRA